jgi:G protein-coupled receptor GPR1
MALAWIPRYIILVVILILYASIYIYVRMKFRTFRSHVGSSTLEMDTLDLAAPEPPKDDTGLPQLDAHGLIPTSPASDSRQASGASDQPFARALIPMAEKLNSCSPDPRTWTYDGSSLPPRRGSLPVSVACPEGGGGDTGSSSETSHQVKALVEEPAGTASAELRRRRIAISRQLRLLFIYPLVYALMWVPSLVSHLLQYRDRFVNHPNFPLACTVAFTIPVQCAVDCWLFTIREKPWRCIPESNGKTFWSRHRFNGGDSNAEGDADCWNRKKLSFQARKAYERRDQERKEAAELWLRRQDEKDRLNPDPGPAEPKRAYRSWWDGYVDDLDEIVEEAQSRRASQSSSGCYRNDLGMMEEGMGRSIP